MKRPGAYSTFDIIKLFDMKRGRLKNWIEQGFITPTFQEPHGAGLKSYFDKRGLYSLRLFQRFLDLGIKRELASEWIKIFEKVNPAQHGSGDPDFILLERSKNDITLIKLHFAENGDLTIKKSNQVDDVFVINFENIRKHVDALLKD